MFNEPSIIINDEKLSVAEAMTLRVAITSFLAEMQEPDALGDDETGRGIQAGYRAACQSIIEKMKLRSPRV